MSRRRVLVSVSDKEGLQDFVKGLLRLDYEIISTGGTARYLRAGGARVTEVSEVTGFPEILGGRVKTLHPKIHGGLLGIRENEEHRRQMRDQAIHPIDMLVVNLYPFQQTVARPESLWRKRWNRSTSAAPPWFGRQPRTSGKWP